MQSYTVADFLPSARIITCRDCGAEMETSVSLDGPYVVARLICPGGHDRKFSWKAGTPPPHEAVLAMEGG